MKKLIYSLLSLTIFTTLLIGCGSDSPFMNMAKKGIESQDYESALAAIDSVLAENPNNLEAYYYRGVAFGEKASSNPVIADRKGDYQQMRDALTSIANLKTEGKDAIFELQAENLILGKWGEEHNLAILHATGDSAAPQADDHLATSIDHLNNAVTINPDSTLSFEILAHVYQMVGDYDGAIRAQKDAMALKDEIPEADYSNLATFYMLTDNYEDAVIVLEDALEQYPDSVDLVQKIADSYMNVGENEKAISTLEELISSDPGNAQYRLVMGTQIYIMANKLNDDVSANFNQIFDLDRTARSLSGDEKKEVEARIESMREENATKLAESDRLTNRAITELEKVTELNPNDANAYNTLGIVYQNKAALFFDQRNATTDNALADEFDEKAKGELLKAKDSYEKATSLDPDNQEYWGALFRVYTALNMKEEAEAAMEKAGY